MDRFLQGRPLGHPLHPFLVHFPIGLFALSLLLDVLAFILPDTKGLVQGAWYTMFLGVVMGILAAIPGFADLNSIRKDHTSRKIATLHMVLNLLVVLTYGVNLVLRYSETSRDVPSSLPLILSLIAFAMLGVSGHLGGKLIFDDGIAVGRHRRKTDMPKRTIKPASGIERDGDGFIVIARDRELDESETLRAEVEGIVIALARVDGEVYAFQEFCTHRFGPLSEGYIHNGEIECPWHCSRFDIRTGLVTHGPAKQKLRIFTTRVSDGMIAVSVNQPETSEGYAETLR